MNWIDFVTSVAAGGNPSPYECGTSWEYTKRGLEHMANTYEDESMGPGSEKARCAASIRNYIRLTDKEIANGRPVE